MTSNFERFKEIGKQADSESYSSLCHLEPKKRQMSGNYIWESCSPFSFFFSKFQNFQNFSKPFFHFDPRNSSKSSRRTWKCLFSCHFFISFAWIGNETQAKSNTSKYFRIIGCGVKRYSVGDGLNSRQLNAFLARHETVYVIYHKVHCLVFKKNWTKNGRRRTYNKEFYIFFQVTFFKTFRKLRQSKCLDLLYSMSKKCCTVVCSESLCKELLHGHKAVPLKVSWKLWIDSQSRLQRK